MPMTLYQIQELFYTGLASHYTRAEIRIIFNAVAEKIVKTKPDTDRQEVSGKEMSHFGEMLEALQSGKPYQQVIGETEFYGLNFKVNEHVLIPRPETEELLELALQQLMGKTKLKILDIGTGSGIIPVVLKKHLPDAEVRAVDISPKALKIASENAKLQKVDIKFNRMDYLRTELEGQYDVFISNPPYIGLDEEVDIFSAVKDFEPTIALFAPVPDPLVFYRKIAEDCKIFLKKGGFVFLEINQLLGPETLALFTPVLEEASLVKDLSGNDRFVVGRK